MKDSAPMRLDARDGVRPDLGLLALRVLAGSLMFFGHGLSKVMSWTERSQTFFDPFGLGPGPSLALAIFAEAGCSLAIMAGFMTRLATLPLLITMFVAAFMANAGEPWNKQELAMAFATMFFTILVAGPGRYSVDAILRRTNRQAQPTFNERATPGA
jgi:putative oxidoreductase